MDPSTPEPSLTARLRAFRHGRPSPAYELLTEAIDQLDWLQACQRAAQRKEALQRESDDQRAETGTDAHGLSADGASGG
jgi:hypothetical protein